MTDPAADATPPMTRILHTGDLHLSEKHPERWEALDALVALAGEHEPDALLIAGDLLDRDEDHAVLRGRVRDRLESVAAPVYLVPGNHDRDAYADGQDWGAETRVLLEEPVSTTRIAGAQLVALPYPAEPATFRQLRDRVAAVLEAAPPRLLCLHGTLIESGDPHILAETRDEEPGRYLPIRREDLESLPVEYVALGHYHQHDRREGSGTVTAYAGAPSPIGAHALGPRSAILVALGDEAVTTERLYLPVPYRDRLRLWIAPFEEAAGLEELAARLEERADPRCSLEVGLDGILARMTEAELRERVETLEDEYAERFESLRIDRHAVGLDAARAELFREFRRRLEERALEAEEASEPLAPELRQRVLELGARALKS